MRYLEVAEDLRRIVASGPLGGGGALPSESELTRRYRVSRVTVRRALEVLRDEGLVRSRQGAGWFVNVDPVRQALGRFATVEAAMEAAGVEPRREIREFGFGPAPDDVAAALGAASGAEVLRVRRVNLGDGDPFGLVTVWVPAALAAELSRADAERSTFYELIGASGVELGRAIQTIRAEVAGPDDVLHLGVAEGDPLLVCERVTEDAEGRPVLFSEHRYPAQRTSFEVELPRVAPAAGGPVGLRVVEEMARTEAS